MSIVKQVDDYLVEEVFQKIVNKTSYEFANVGWSMVFCGGYMASLFMEGMYYYREKESIVLLIFLLPLTFCNYYMLHTLNSATKRGFKSPHRDGIFLRIVFLMFIPVDVFLQNNAGLLVTLTASCFFYFAATSKAPPNQTQFSYARGAA